MAKPPELKFQKRYLLLILVLLIAMYVVVPQIGGFKSSLSLLTHPSLNWTLLAVALSLGTYAAGTATYCLLAFKRLSYYLTLLVQLAAMFVNRLLPAGVGALGVNYLYLHKHRHSNAQAVSVVTINNLLGSTGHLIILLLVLATAGSSNSALVTKINLADWWHNILIVSAVLIVVVLALVVSKGKLRRFAVDLKKQLWSYRTRPAALLMAQTSSIILTLLNVMSFAACAVALGVQFDFTALFLIFTLGVALGAATPTPGGLGGFEAGLAAGLTANGVDSPTALAVALLYRLVSYWLPLLIGAVAFIFTQRSGVLSGAD